MALNGVEKELLEEIAKRLVVKKAELVEFLQGRVEDPFSITNSLIQSFKDKELITYVQLIGESCIAITQKGMRKCGVQKD